LDLLFADLGPGESELSRFLTAAVFFFLSGLFIGYLNPKAWLLAGLNAWGGVFLGLVAGIASLSGLPEAPKPYGALAILFGPLGLALLGSRFGAQIGRKRVVSRLAGRLFGRK